MSFRRTISMLLLAAYLPACTAYHLTDMSVAQLTAPPKPVERVRVTKEDGTRVQVWEPRVARDSVIGMKAAPGKDTARVAVSLGDIREVEVQKVDALKTAGGVLVVGTVLAGFFALVLFASCDDNCWNYGL
jgi:hypothetical protein